MLSASARFIVKKSASGQIVIHGKDGRIWMPIFVHRVFDA